MLEPKAAQGLSSRSPAGQREEPGVRVRPPGYLKPEIPLALCVFLAGEAGDLVEGDGVQRRGGVPGLAEGGLDRLLGDAEVDEEFGMGAVASVVGLAGGLGQNFREQPEIEVQQ